MEIAEDSQPRVLPGGGSATSSLLGSVGPLRGSFRPVSIVSCASVRARPTILSTGSVRTDPTLFGGRVRHQESTLPDAGQSTGVSPTGLALPSNTSAKRPISLLSSSTTSSAMPNIVPHYNDTARQSIHDTIGADAGPRRHSSVMSGMARRGTATLHHPRQHFGLTSGSQLDVGDRTGSKLTLDEELYDILYAFQ
ncbi:hypothetical protein Ddc_05603 [Ditylenchus destructor]|nr:hypothetical protein Ddc_05603 [Ditylenchus destructor]